MKVARGLLLVVALAILCVRIHACGWEEEDAIKYTPWCYAPLDDKNPFCLAYEVLRTGNHTVDVHLKNYTRSAMSLEFRLSPYQSANEHSKVQVPPNFPGDQEAVVHLALKAGGPGLIFSNLHVRNASAQASLAPQTESDSTTGEAWFGVVPDMEMGAFGSENASYRIAQRGAEWSVTFRNTSRQAEFFDFEILGYPLAGKAKNPRVKLAVGAEQTVSLQIARPDAMLSLARVKVFNIHADHDTGNYLDMKELENGWFSVVSVDFPGVNPRLVVYRLDAADGDAMNIRFKNLSGRPVSFKYGVGRRPVENPVKVQPDAEATIAVHIPGDAMTRALTRVRVAELAFLPEPPAR